ncbi:MAG: S1C family serine protease [Candidatus Saccharimonadales bacterium]
MDQQPNSVKSKKPRQARTITLTIPKLPRVRFSRMISKGQAWFMLAVLVVGIAGGILGGWVESAGFKGQLLTSSTKGTQLLRGGNTELISNIANKLSPGVVSISADTTTQSSNYFGFSQPVQQQSEGTGIIISSNGLVMTNRHVVPAGTTSVSITLSNGTQLNDISVVGRTSTSDSLDIAILKINNAEGQTLTPLVLGDSSQVQVGDGVVAIGNALGEFQNTVTSGIISGFGRNISASSGSGNSLFGSPSTSSASSETLTDMFQTDAAINEGNSGGPLVNLNGQVIGLNTAIASNSQNIGFAIPINEVKGLVKAVIATGKFERPFLGVRFILLTPALAKQYSLHVSNGAYIPKSNASTPSIVAGSAAAKAGLKPGDVITKVNGDTVNSLDDLTMLIDQYQPGSVIKLTVVRGTHTIVISVKLGMMS